MYFGNQSWDKMIRVPKPLIPKSRLREVEDTRARLQAFADKVHPYPYVVREELLELEPEPLWTARQWDSVEQLKSEVTGWRKKHAEMLLKLDQLTKQKPKSKYG